MADLFNQQISATYSGLLKTSSSGVLSASLTQITDGRGNGSPLYISTTVGAVDGAINFYNAYTFPSADGLDGQVLKTDGAGVLTWENDSLSNTLNFSGGTGTGSVTLDTQTLAFTGTANQIETSASSQAITLSFPTAGVTLPDGSVATTQTANDDSTKVATTAYVEAAVAAGGVGNVTKTGTPSTNEVAIWTNSNTIKGDASFTMSSSTFQINNSTASSQSNLIISNNDTAINSIPANIIFNSNTLTSYKTLAQIYATKTDADIANASGKLNFSTTDAGVPSVKFIINSNGLSEFFGNVNAYNTSSLKLYSLGQEGYSNTEFLEIKKSSTNAIFNVNKVGTGSVRGLEFQTGGSPKLTISSVGDATFNGVLTAQSLRTSTSNEGYNLISRGGSGGVCLYVQGNTGGSLLDVRYGSTTAGGGTSALKIDGTGAATFGGSVTAGGLVTINKINEGLILTAGANTDASYMSTRANNGTGWMIMGSQGTTSGYIQSGTGANESAITTVGAYALALGTNQIERLRISSGGNVGIGVNSPSVRLDVGGASNSDSTARFAKTNEGTLLLGGNRSTSNCPFIGSENNFDFAFITNNTEKMRITSGGDVLFRATAMPSASNLVGSAFKYDSKSRMTLVQASDNNNLTDLQEYFNSNGAVGKIQTNGSATLFTTSSDYRLKENVTPITDALSRVNQLKPSRFNFIADADKIVDGFIAHEVQDIVPEAISGEKDAMRDEEFELTPRVDEVTDEDGNVITEAVDAVMETRSVPDYQGIDQSKIVPLLTAAIQEQQTIIEDLKARIETLEG